MNVCMIVCVCLYVWLPKRLSALATWAIRSWLRLLLSVTEHWHVTGVARGILMSCIEVSHHALCVVCCDASPDSCGGAEVPPSPQRCSSVRSRSACVAGSAYAPQVAFRVLSLSKSIFIIARDYSGVSLLSSCPSRVFGGMRVQQQHGVVLQSHRFHLVSARLPCACALLE